MKCQKKGFKNFHLYFLYISIINEERLPFSFDNNSNVLNVHIVTFIFIFILFHFAAVKLVYP